MGLSLAKQDFTRENRSEKGLRRHYVAAQPFFGE
jgi:hypothetical protein